MSTVNEILESVQAEIVMIDESTEAQEIRFEYVGGGYLSLFFPLNQSDVAYAKTQGAAIVTTSKSTAWEIVGACVAYERNRT